MQVGTGLDKQNHPKVPQQDNRVDGKTSKKNVLEFGMVTKSQEKELSHHSTILQLHSRQCFWTAEGVTE